MITYSNVLIQIAPRKAIPTCNFCGRPSITQMRFWSEDYRRSVAAPFALQYRFLSRKGIRKPMADIETRLNAGRL